MGFSIILVRPSPAALYFRKYGTDVKVSAVDSSHQARSEYVCRTRDEELIKAEHVSTVRRHIQNTANAYWQTVCVYARCIRYAVDFSIKLLNFFKQSFWRSPTVKLAKDNLINHQTFGGIRRTSI